MTTPLLSNRAEALRTILLEDPAAIEDLPEAESTRLGRLLEANRLEPLLYDLARRTGHEGRLSPSRLSAWRMAHLCAVGRATAFREALDDILDLASARDIPVQLLPGPQLAFFVHSSPELRPLGDLEVRVPGHCARDLQAALRTRRFFETEDIVSFPHSSRFHLPPLERDGAVLRVYFELPLDLGADLDPGIDLPAVLQGGRTAMPLLLGPEALFVLVAHEMASRHFGHSLQLLHDLHVLARRDGPAAGNLFLRVEEPNLRLEGLVCLSILETLLGTPIDPALLDGLRESAGLSDARRKLLLKLARTAVLQYPASPRVLGTVARLTRDARTKPQPA